MSQENTLAEPDTLRDGRGWGSIQRKCRLVTHAYCQHSISLEDEHHRLLTNMTQAEMETVQKLRARVFIWVLVLVSEPGSLRASVNILLKPIDNMVD